MIDDHHHNQIKKQASRTQPSNSPLNSAYRFGGACACGPKRPATPGPTGGTLGLACQVFFLKKPNKQTKKQTKKRTEERTDERANQQTNKLRGPLLHAPLARGRRELRRAGDAPWLCRNSGRATRFRLHAAPLKAPPAKAPAPTPELRRAGDAPCMQVFFFVCIPPTPGVP